MVPYAPHASTIELAARLGASAHVATVVGSTDLSTGLREVVLNGHAAELAGRAGNDVMVLVEPDEQRIVRRRYSVRSVDVDADQFTLWVTTGHDGAGSRWAQRCAPGELVDVIGPRGQIGLDPLADWHLFVGDTSGLAAFYRLAQSIDVPGRAIFIVEIDHPDDALVATFDEGLGVTGIFVDRAGRSRDNPAGLLRGLAAFAFPPDSGHAYLFGEFTTMKAVHAALRDRGLEEIALSRKAFWRVGRHNADHGEPDKGEA